MFRYRLKRFSINIFSVYLQCLASCLAGCAVGPNYRQLPVEAPAKWTYITKNLEASQTKLPSSWWNSLNETALNTLMDAALQNNPSIAQAVARIEQARANKRREESFSKPMFAAHTNLTHAYSKTDSRIPLMGITDTNQLFPSQTTSNTNINISWELDIFGRTRRSIEAAQARLDSHTAEADSVRLSLQAQIVENWFLLRACELQSVQLNLDTQLYKDIYMLTGLRVTAGFSTSAEQALIESNWAEAQIEQDSHISHCKQLRQTLIALSGMTTSALDALLPPDATASELPVPLSFSLGVPAYVLTQRFDIISAERNLAAASASIGLAEATQYPSLSLSSALGKQWIRTGGMAIDFNVGSLGPSLTLPLFDGGQRRAEIDRAYAHYEELKNAVRERVRQAAKEVETALLRIQAAQTKEKSLTTTLQAYHMYLQAAEARYKAGSLSFIELKSQQHQWLTLQKKHIVLRLELLQAWISLIRAAGGAPDGSVRAVS